MYKLKMTYAQKDDVLNGDIKSIISHRMKCDTLDECKQLINALFEEISNSDIKRVLITIIDDNGDEE